MTERTPEHPNTPGGEHPQADAVVRRLRPVRTSALVAVVCLPPVLNATNIVAWANSPDGLDMSGAWGWVVFAGLDLIAAVCVLETLIQSQLGRKAGAFALFVWVFALASAYAGYRHGTEPGAGRDVKWFFPLMAVAGPALLHIILKRSRLDKQLGQGRRLTHAPASAYGWSRWIPGIGAFGETYCSWRLGRLEGIVLPAVAIARYRALRPNAGRSGMRVLRALRGESERLRVDEQTSTERTAKVAKPNAEPAPNTPLANKPNSKPRTPKPDTSRATNTGPSNGDTAANLERVKAHFPDWRTNTPSVRKIAVLLGVAVSTGSAYQNRLLADRASTDAEERAS